ncbi:MAG: hypothetical protein KIT24_08815 [Phycisphaeraceae bacterium]|nr:hypothetical protein [Phycisphaeraceae bacterium]
MRNALIGLILLLAVAAAQAQPGQLVMRTERVIIFKNGYGLVVKNATGIADQFGHVATQEVPSSAVLGSFWVIPEDDKPVRFVRATTESVREPRRHAGEVANITQLLAANIGQHVTLHLHHPQQPLTGTIVQVLHGWAESSTPNTHAQVVLNSDQGGMVIMPTSAVTRLDGANLQWSYDLERSEPRMEKRLVIGVAPNQQVSMQIVYFTPNIRWIPTYRLDDISQSEVNIRLQGEILNELEDLNGVSMSLVVGVPSFRFQDVVSPLSLEPALFNALVSAAPGVMGQQAYQTQFSNDYALRAGERRGAAVAGLPDPGEEGLAAGEHDLYVYDIGPMTLRRGDRVAVPIWSAAAPAAHIYTFDLAIKRSHSGSCTVTDKNDLRAIASAAHGSSPLGLAATRVWHQLDLKNTTKHPWTTGPAIAFDAGIPIAQDLLTYTSAGGNTLLPLTVATDIRGKYDEEELSREPNVLRWGNHQFSRVVKRCTVTLTSYRQERGDVRVSVAIGGKAISASDGGKILVTDTHRDDWDENTWMQVNNHSDVKWSLVIEPGKTVTVTFDVEYYLY